MCGSSRCLRISVLFLSSIMLLAVAWRSAASADDSANYVLTEDALNKTLGALSDLRSKGLPISVGGGSLESEIANLKKQPKVAKIIKKRGLSLREFVLAYKSAAQIREAENARDNWQKILADSNTTPQAKFEATQKLGESLRTNLFTPEQIELVRRRMPDLESLFPTTK
jgi:hypothetical protein